MSPEELAIKIGIQPFMLKRLSRRADRCYFSFYKTKKSGAKRTIDAPNQELKGIQAWILRNILEHIVVHNCCHGFVKKRGIKTNAMQHLDKKYVCRLDLKDFFPSIDINRVKPVFENYTHDDTSANILSRLCTFHSYLPQGAVTSPALSNIVFTESDQSIAEVCGAKRIIYTRYADDLTFSSNNRARIFETTSAVKTIIRENGFEINNEKTQFFGGKGPTRVTGVNLNPGYLSIGRRRKRELRASLHNLIVKENEHVDINRTLGMLSFLRDIEPTNYEKTVKYLKRLKTQKRP